MPQSKENFTKKLHAIRQTSADIFTALSQQVLSADLQNVRLYQIGVIVAMVVTLERPFCGYSHLLTTSFQPSSCLFPFFGLGKVDIFVVAVVVVRVTARHWAAAVATVIGESALWGVVWVIMVLATTLVISAVFMTLMTSLDLRRRKKVSKTFCGAFSKIKRPVLPAKRVRSIKSLIFLPVVDSCSDAVR